MDYTERISTFNAKALKIVEALGKSDEDEAKRRSFFQKMMIAVLGAFGLVLLVLLFAMAGLPA